MELRRVLFRSDLLEVFNRMDHGDWKLVVVGQADHTDKYSVDLERRMRENSGVVSTGFLSGDALRQIFHHAGLFVLPSYHEGLPIVLLEAMSLGLSCVASDIPANREVGLQDMRYFPPGDRDKLEKILAHFIHHPPTAEERLLQTRTIAAKHDWDNIAQRTFAVYQELFQ